MIIIQMYKTDCWDGSFSCFGHNLEFLEEIVLIIYTISVVDTLLVVAQFSIQECMIHVVVLGIYLLYL